MAYQNLKHFLAEAPLGDLHWFHDMIHQILFGQPLLGKLPNRGEVVAELSDLFACHDTSGIMGLPWGEQA